MIAEQHDGAAAALRCLRLDLHQEVHHRPHTGAAVGVVAGLDERRVAAGPAPRLVEETRGLHDRDELVEGAVDVTDGDDAPRLRGGGAGEQHGRER